MCEQAVDEQVRRLQVVEGPPVGAAQEGRDEGAEALEAALREVAPFNAGPLRLGVLQVRAAPGCMGPAVGSFRRWSPHEAAQLQGGTLQCVAGARLGLGWLRISSRS